MAESSRVTLLLCTEKQIPSINVHLYVVVEEYFAKNMHSKQEEFLLNTMNNNEGYNDW